jgi:hypothetical protein
VTGEKNKSQWSCKANRYFFPAEIRKGNVGLKWEIFYSFYEMIKERPALLPLQAQIIFSPNTSNEWFGFSKPIFIRELTNKNFTP